jgi:hypothetical protein
VRFPKLEKITRILVSMKIWILGDLAPSAASWGRRGPGAALPRQAWAGNGVERDGETVGASGIALVGLVLKRYSENMTAAEVIEDIKQLPREEQSQVVQFAVELARSRQLSGEELGIIAQKMLDAKDPGEKKRLREELTRGFYGD